MTIFGLNSPEIFLIFVIILTILGTKRIEKGLILFSRLLKFLLSNQTLVDKKIKLKKDIEGAQKEEEETIKNEDSTNTKELTSIKDIEEAQKEEEESEIKLKQTNSKNIEKKSIKRRDSKGIKNNKTIKKLKTNNSKNIVKDKTVKKSKTINVKEEGLDK